MNPSWHIMVFLASTLGSCQSYCFRAVFRVSMGHKVFLYLLIPKYYSSRTYLLMVAFPVIIPALDLLCKRSYLHHRTRRRVCCCCFHLTDAKVEASRCQTPKLLQVDLGRAGIYNQAVCAWGIWFHHCYSSESKWPSKDHSIEAEHLANTSGKWWSL